MEDNQKKEMKLGTKIFIVLNTLLFGITGVVYLIKGNNIIGYVLLAAGLTNIFYALLNIHIRSIIFVVLLFLFAVVSLIVSFDSIGSKDTTIGIIWMVITLLYLIFGFILLMQVQKSNRQKE